MAGELLSFHRQHFILTMVRCVGRCRSQSRCAVRLEAMETELTDITADTVRLPRIRTQRRWLRGLVLGAAALATLTLAWNIGARVTLTLLHPPPGERIDVGGYTLHLNCTGEPTSQPTIILEAGNADFSVHW